MYAREALPPAWLLGALITVAQMTSQDKPGHILLDAMGFGMGCGCVQCTFQCCNINEARMLYDQLAIILPILV